MVDVYLLTLALSIGIGVAATLVLLALSRTERFLALFHVRGVMEKPRWGGAVFLAAFALTPYVASAISPHAAPIRTVILARRFVSRAHLLPARGFRRPLVAFRQTT